ncbi:hypothetical protein FQN57_006304 [Myotisia sp. PD_48]|nr:hypothetical protein FQN57_006304 [Myotisia sp. PD_48]
MVLSKKLVSLGAFFSLPGIAYAGWDPARSNNIALYWGQNSYGKGTGDLAQQRLSHYCDNKDVDVIQLSFMTRIKGLGNVPQVNFANQGDICKPFPGTDLLHCPQIGEDIKACQAKGKAILLSIGGATYSEGGFGSSDEAIASANLVWDIFGPSKSNSSTVRPFDSAVVDGFDLDFEATVKHMIPFANRLRELYKTDSSKRYYLTAAPQCPYPDMNNKEMLDGGVKFDALFIQFYNNFCGVNSFKPGSKEQPAFNFAEWDKWAKSTSGNKDVKIVVGAPANSGAAGSGYVDAKSLVAVTAWCKSFSTFGGVMLWDASQGWANSGFISTVKQGLSSTASQIMCA